MSARTAFCPAFCTGAHDFPDGVTPFHADTPDRIPGVDGDLTVDMSWHEDQPEPLIFVEGRGLTAAATEALIEYLAGRTFRAREAMKAASR